MLHSNKVIHCDVNPYNFLLDSRLRLRIIDFSGSSINGTRASALESVRFRLPRPRGSPLTILRDLFALGSTIYAYEKLRDEEVEARFKQGIFPLVDGLACGEIIKKCWHSEFNSVREVQASIEVEMQKYRTIGPIRYHIAFPSISQNTPHPCTVYSLGPLFDEPISFELQATNLPKIKSLPSR